MKKHHLGFIDPISLITLSFLIVGLVVTTSIVKNPDISLDIRQWAKVCMDPCDCGDNEECYQPTRGCPVCRAKRQAATPAQTAPAQTATTTQPQVTAHLEPEETQYLQSLNKPTTTQAPTTQSTVTQPTTTTPNTPTCTVVKLNTAGTCPDGKTIKYVWRNADCTTKTDECPSLSTTTQSTVTQPTTPIPPKEPYCSRSCPGNSYCEPDVTGGRCVKDLPPKPLATTKPSTPTTPTTITQDDCNKCLEKNSPSECSGACKNIGKAITTPVDKTECAPKTKLCSGNSLKTCSDSGTWGFQTCANGCANGACKVPTLKQYGDTCTSGSECASGTCAGTSGGKGYNPGASKHCTPATAAEYAQQTALAAGPFAVAFGGIMAAPVATQVIAAANLVDDTATAIACINGNQNACAYVLPAITNPIPGMSLASQYADDLAALAKPVTNFFDDLAWLRNLPNADDAAGWTLGTSGRQTIISRSNMPDNLTPKEQALWIAMADVKENWGSYTQLPGVNSSMGYTESSASQIYSFQTLNDALQTMPDPTGFLAKIRSGEIRSTTQLTQMIEDLGLPVIPASTVPLTSDGVYGITDTGLIPWGFGSLTSTDPSATTYARFFPGGEVQRNTNLQGTPFFATNPNPDPNISNSQLILVNDVIPTTNRKLSVNLGHELGHFAESFLSPSVNIPNVNRPVNAATEYISSLYGITAGIHMPSGSVNEIVEAISNQVFLNTWVSGQNPTQYLNPLSP